MTTTLCPCGKPIDVGPTCQECAPAYRAGGRCNVESKLSRFWLDNETMMLHDTEGEIKPFAIELYEEKAKTIFYTAFKRLVNKCLGEGRTK